MSKQTDMSKVAVKQILDSATRVVAGSLEQGQRVTIRGLGYFSIKESLPRKIYNPRKSEFVMSAGTKKVIFKQSPTLKIKNG